MKCINEAASPPPSAHREDPAWSAPEEEVDYATRRTGAGKQPYTRHHETRVDAERDAEVATAKDREATITRVVRSVLGRAERTTNAVATEASESRVRA